MDPVGLRLPGGWRSLVDPAWLEGWEPRPFGLAGGTTEVVTMGQGATLLLLPPLPGYKEAFAGVARLLARRFRVVTFDLRARFDGPASWQTLVDDLERVAEAFAPGPALVLGHSLGGALAQLWTLQHPGRVGALVLSSSFARVSAPPGHVGRRYFEQPLVLASQRILPRAWARALARRFARHGAWVYDPRCDDRVLDFVRFGIRALPLRVARQCVALALAHDTRASLGYLRCPTLLLVGERETAWARAAGDELATLLPRSERRIAPGVSHLHPLSSPEWLAATVGEWAAGALARS
jgi:3-oxoadipate enol-lactonase